MKKYYVLKEVKETLTDALVSDVWYSRKKDAIKEAEFWNRAGPIYSHPAEKYEIYQIHVEKLKE